MKKTEGNVKTLDESKRRYQTTLDNIPGMVFRCNYDSDWTMTFVSSGCYELTGFTADEFINHRHGLYNDLIYPDDRKFVRDTVDASIEDQDHYELEYRIKTRSKKIKWVWEKGKYIKDIEKDTWHIEGVILDITEKKSAENKINQLARYDLTTNLPNEHYLEEFLERQISVTDNKKFFLAIMAIGLSDYSKIRTTDSKKNIDKLCYITGRNIKKYLNRSDFLAYINNGVFVFVKMITRRDKLKFGLTLEKITHECTININEHSLYDYPIKLFAGISIYPDDAKSPASLIESAVETYKRQKKSVHHGKNYAFYSKVLHDKLKKELIIEKSLIPGVNAGQFYLVYQPIMDLQQNRIHALEALVRWEHPIYKLLSPDYFIPLAEVARTINTLEEWIINHAINEFSTYLLPIYKSLRLAVNVSANHLLSEHLATIFTQAISNNNIDGKSIIIEITETSITALSNNNYNLQYFSSNNFTLSIDDFGTGQSSIARILELPINEVKLDKSLIDQINSKKGQKFIIGILTICDSIGLKVIAEGIETKAQYQFLLEHGCHFGQGYYFSKPQRYCEIVKFIKKNKN